MPMISFAHLKMCAKQVLKHINTDLIIGLPGENEADATDTIKKVIDLQPDDITLHALALKKGSELKLIRDNIVLPDDETVQNMSAIMTKAVADYGLIPLLYLSSRIYERPT